MLACVLAAGCVGELSTATDHGDTGGETDSEDGDSDPSWDDEPEGDPDHDPEDDWGPCMDGCLYDEECAPDERCVPCECVPDLWCLHSWPEPECGDGVQTANEECDGAQDCAEGCLAPDPPQWSIERPDAEFIALALDPDGSVLVTGSTELPEAPRSVFVRKLGPDGQQHWSWGPEDLTDIRDVAVTADGTALLAATRRLAEDDVRPWIVALDHAGALLWDVVDDEHGMAWALTIAPDGSLLVLDTVAGTPFRLAKRDATGSLMWALEPPGRARGLATDNGGNVYVAGETEHVVDGWYVNAGWIGAYNGDGEELWSDVVWTRGAYGAHDIAVTTDGHVVIAGNAGSGMWIRAYERSGNLLWDHTCFGSAAGYGEAVAAAADGRVVVGGAYAGVRPSSPYELPAPWVLVLDPDGQPEWTRSLSILNGADHGSAHDVAVGGDGSITAIGSRRLGDQQRAWITRW
jgi:hypothetical protein